MRFSVVIVLFASALGLTGCKKSKSACETRCEKLVTCYAETRGDVQSRAASVKRCARFCKGKAASRYRKAVDRFGSLSCTDFMKRFPQQADFIVRGGGKGGGRPAARASRGNLVSPFPALVGHPPTDPKARRTWRSPVQRLVDRIVIRKSKAVIELRRVAPGKRPGDVGSWVLEQPEKTKADRYAVRNLLNRLERMRFQRASGIGPKDYPRYAVDDKHGVRCTVYAGSKVLADMLVGRADRTGAKRRGPVSTMLRKVGSNDVFRVVGSLTYLFKRPAAGWRDATVIHVQREDVRRLEIQTERGRLVVERDPTETDPRKRFTNWKVVQSKPALPSLDQNAVTRLVSVLTHLRATNTVVKLEGVDTGLAKPRGVLTLVDKSGKQVVLLIGNKDGRRRSAFGQIRGDKRVFRLRTPLDDLPSRPITTFRDKTLVRAKLDQVVAVGVQKQGKWSRFRKEGRQWKAVAPQGLAFNRSRLISTVRLLEGRFSAYEFATKTDPKTTGLDRPAGRIEVRVKAGPDKPAKDVVILIGKPGRRGDYYVQVKGAREVMLVRRWVLSRIWRTVSEWSGGARPRHPL